MKKKGQAAFSVLLEYSWFIIAVAASLATFIYYTSSLYICLPGMHLTLPGIIITDQKFTGNDGPDPFANNRFFFTLANRANDPIIIQNITLKQGDTICGNFQFPGGGQLFADGQESSIIQAIITDPSCQGRSGRCYKYDVEIEHHNTQQSLSHLATGKIFGEYELQAERWSIASWQVTNYSDRIVNNSNNQFLSICTAPPVPPVNQFNTSIPNPINWTLPSGCATGGIAQVGFANACNNVAPQLSKGWLHTQLHVDPLFATHTIYLEGDASYFDEDDMEMKTNGICLNDNLYFYMNGVLRYYGGTTGVMVGSPNTFESGDEVIRNCGNCQHIDSSAWCIPAFELTTAGLNFGQSNDIHVLIEDFCRGGGQTNAGGMSLLNFNMV